MSRTSFIRVPTKSLGIARRCGGEETFDFFRQMLPVGIENTMHSISSRSSQ